MPCLVIVYCYGHVSAALRRRARHKIGTGPSPPAAAATAGQTTSSTIARFWSRRQRQSQHQTNGGSLKTAATITFDDDYDDDQPTITTRSVAIASVVGGNAMSCGPGSELRQRVRIQRKRRTNRMLIAMVAIFAVCWMPLNAILLTIEYNEELTQSPYFLTVFFVAHVIAVSSTIYNPFLYAWMNDNFRKEFRRVLPCLYSLSACIRRRRLATASCTLCGRRLAFRLSVSADLGSCLRRPRCGRTGGGDIDLEDPRASPSYYTTVGPCDPATTFGADVDAYERTTVFRLGRLSRKSTVDQQYKTYENDNVNDNDDDEDNVEGNLAAAAAAAGRDVELGDDVIVGGAVGLTSRDPLTSHHVIISETETPPHPVNGLSQQQQQY